MLPGADSWGWEGRERNGTGSDEGTSGGLGKALQVVPPEPLPGSRAPASLSQWSRDRHIPRQDLSTAAGDRSVLWGGVGGTPQLEK